MKRRIVVVFSLLLGATFGGLTKGYADTHQGTAIFSGDPTQVFRSANQPNRVAASVAAKQQCEQARSKREGYCEIVSIDGAKVGRAVELKPDDKTHPLFLWRYNNGQATVYLGGTVHVLKEGFYPLPRQYEQAFQASEKLVVEAAIDKIEPEQLQKKMLSYALLKQGTLRDVLSPSTYQQLNHYAQTYGLPLEQMQGFNPALISQQLSVFAIMAMGYDPTLGMEAHYSARIEPENVFELESVDAQFQLLLGQPLDVQRAMLRDALAQFDDITEQTNDLLRAWASGDDRRLGALIRDQTGSSPESQQFMRELLDDRNINMAKGIAEMLQSSGSYFVLVGSAHLAGPQSVITELKQRGFSGQRIYANDPSVN
ncbi:MAG: TraB/GumN family protein [Pseudomonadales bacterium]